ncbi:unnamed protein product [Rotaria magnacalcarata]|uniref:Uncharacterized protein n=1 Tax=Rotaria magnacalcarata TaxID=392030 RepID=A0A819N462_9BILA|nr:unnamed protein product [Rotaria magnacalcarata]CAF1605815.1 unnamed protein product [Rotaria magnacalcarata]CAF1998629.1 unnamed protein product [Rotaria magnacalcarata]CAF2107648.1 unnamed protein product [Rotaria magnacalcarata]CAF2140665.1 unnamed protein product [Rotaria magnacalcarata]
MHASRAFCAAPRHVYAGVISNKTSKPLKCTIHYATGTNNNTPNESISVTLDAGGRACIPEREYKPTPEATFTCRKVVSRIEVHDDEKPYALEQPFDGVTCPVTEWRFDLHNDHIASVNPTTLATPTKIENPVIAQ